MSFLDALSIVADDQIAPEGITPQLLAMVGLPFGCGIDASRLQFNYGGPVSDFDQLGTRPHRMGTASRAVLSELARITSTFCVGAMLNRGTYAGKNGMITDSGCGPKN